MGADVPSPCTFLEILSGNAPKYDSDIDHYTPANHINGDVSPEEAPELTPLDQSPYNDTIYPQEKADHLRAWQVDLEAVEAELERQR
jgi:hypothetical protein